MNYNSKIFITGHKGLVGSSIFRYLKKKNFNNIITIEKKNLDLRENDKVLLFFLKNKFDYVIDCAGKVGGIKSNLAYQAEFIYDNLMIQSNIIHSCFLTKVKSLIYLGSSSIYPMRSKIPMKEEYLLSGRLEKSNEFYSVAKIAGIKMCESYNLQYKTNYKCLMLCNLFGPNDNYHSENSHFLPSLIKKIFLAKKKNQKNIIIWGTGKPKREIMYVDDVASACLFFLKKKTNHTLINVGSGIEKSIYEYAKIIANKLEYQGKFIFDTSKPDGIKRKLMCNKLATNYGWKSSYSFEEGLNNTIAQITKEKTLI